MLRARTPSATLDDFMREMWQRHGKAQTAALAPARPYTPADVEAALAVVAKDPAFARDFMARYVVGSELPDYPTLLVRAGFLVRQAAPEAAWLGDTPLSAFEGRVIVAGPTTIGSPMYEAGLAAGDRLLSIGGEDLATVADYRRVLAARKPGERVQLSWTGRAGPASATVVLKADPRVEVVAFEDAGEAVTAGQRTFREDWLRARQ
jgi:predicted metalloprotease with PDZ domain